MKLQDSILTKHTSPSPLPLPGRHHTPHRHTHMCRCRTNTLHYSWYQLHVIPGIVSRIFPEGWSNHSLPYYAMLHRTHTLTTHTTLLCRRLLNQLFPHRKVHTITRRKVFPTLGKQTLKIFSTIDTRDTKRMYRHQERKTSDEEVRKRKESETAFSVWIKLV